MKRTDNEYQERKEMLGQRMNDEYMHQYRDVRCKHWSLWKRVWKYTTHIPAIIWLEIVWTIKYGRGIDYVK